MQILMVTADLNPYAPGAAGNSVAALSLALSDLGHSVTVVLPMNHGFEEAGLMMARRLTPLSLDGGGEVTVYNGQLPSGLKLVLFESEELERRRGAYGEDGKDYPDNAARFGVLCKAAAAYAEQKAKEGEAVDVIHGHDWAAAALPALTDIPCLLTVYDATRQGSIPLKELAVLGIGEEPELRAKYRLGNRGNVLKGGMLSAALVSTTSPCYAAELPTGELSGAFGAALIEAGVEIQGIAGGIDYAVCNPATDSALATRYDAASSELKGTCKAALLKEFDLDLSFDMPLVVFAASLDKTYGADLVAGAMGALLTAEVNVLVVGGGGKALHKQLGAAKLAKLPNYHFVGRDSEADQRRALAAADVALCPGRGPAAVDSVRIAQRYGAVPVALSTAHAGDAIVDCDAELETGTGFLFQEPTVDELVGATQRAISATRRKSWGQLRRRVMRLDLGWERSARRIAQLYRMIRR